MSQTVKPDNLAQAIVQALDEFKDVTEEALKAGLTETAKKTESELQTVSPPDGAPIYKSWSAYLADWTARKTTKTKKSVFSSLVYNKNHYQLAHLLENGHALWQGGEARPFEHIAPIAERAEDDLLKNIKNHLKGD